MSAEVCKECGLVHAAGFQTLEAACADALQTALANLIRLCGEPGFCRGCNSRVFWFRHKESGKLTPYTTSGLNHFIDCPKAKDFKK